MAESDNQRTHRYKHTLKYLELMGLPQTVLDSLSECVTKSISKKQVVVSFMNALLEKIGKKHWGETMCFIIANQFKIENGEPILKTSLRKKLARLTQYSWGRYFVESD